MTWVDHAACLDKPTTWWWPEGRDDYTTGVAIAICRRCPVRVDCLADALATEVWYHYGIRGGLTPTQRSALAKQRRRTS